MKKMMRMCNEMNSFGKKLDTKIRRIVRIYENEEKKLNLTITEKDLAVEQYATTIKLQIRQKNRFMRISQRNKDKKINAKKTL